MQPLEDLPYFCIHLRHSSNFSSHPLYSALAATERCAASDVVEAVEIDDLDVAALHFD
jgi:hypothetical protein